MVFTGKLSSHFSRRRDPGGISSPEEGSDKPTAAIRARLEKKLQIKQKTAFAFNFTVDSDDTEDLQGKQKGAFRLDFNPCDTTKVGKGAREGQERSSGGRDNPRAAQDFVVEVEERGAQPNKKNKSNKKGSGKKKKGGKGKGKPLGKEKIRNLTGEEQPQQDVAAKPPRSCAMGDGGGEMTNSCLSLGVESDSKPKCDDAGQGSATPGGGEEKIILETLRPPPGFTLESWKDPALSGEERRRRRFGSGVRNMAAIQRRSDSRRGMAVDGEPEPDRILGTHGDLFRPDRDKARGHGPVQAAIPVDTTAVGGPSVFSFGFDIGISFNGGS